MRALPPCWHPACCPIWAGPGALLCGGLPGALQTGEVLAWQRHRPALQAVEQAEAASSCAGTGVRAYARTWAMHFCAPVQGLKSRRPCIAARPMGNGLMCAMRA